jgi:hypothetical protein
VRASRASQAADQELSHSEEPFAREPSKDQQRPASVQVSPRIVAQAEQTQAAPNPLLAKPSPQETVVSVSIGRVEVRLNAPPAKAPAKRQPTPPPAPLRPAVSLSDYLKRRDGGRS